MLVRDLLASGLLATAAEQTTVPDPQVNQRTEEIEEPDWIAR